MSGDRPQTGSRDDLRIEASRCLRVRFRESRCSHCCSACPAGAVFLEDGLEVSPGYCTGCLLCTSVCPSGALEFSTDFPACLAQLAKAPEPVLGCRRTREQANSWLPCLGGLSDEHLLVLTHRLPGTLTLNISLCNDCPNCAMLPQLRKRIETLSLPGSGAGPCAIIMADSPERIRHREETVDRRSFFKSFGSSLFQAAAVLSAGTEQTEQRSDYMANRVPTRRELLNRTAERLSQEQAYSIQARFEHRITFSSTCTTCQGCAAICPTGALLTGSLTCPPQFDPKRCTGCGLCVDFCLDGALGIVSPNPCCAAQSP